MACSALIGGEKRTSKQVGYAHLEIEDMEGRRVWTNMIDSSIPRLFARAERVQRNDILDL